MRSIRMLAAVTAALLLASACGDGGGGTPPPDNEAPVANFTVPSCVINVACTFTDASSDDVAVTAWDWNFGDNTAHANTEDAAHTYTVAGTYSVVLTVTDAEGLTGTKSAQIIIAPEVVPPGNTPPVAGFTHACTAGNCTFTNTSTDADAGAVLTYLWDFGEPASGANNTSNLEDPTHAYTVTAPTDFTVTLTVTDNAGATDVETQTVSVSPAPPTSQDCTTAGTIVACDLVLTARATVQITLTGVSCELGAQRVFLPAPIGPKQVFGNVCSRTAGEVYTLTDGTGAPRVLEAGTVLPVRFEQGDPDVGDPAVGAPAGTVDGTFGTWTISFDDGGNPTGVGEPDFTDVVITVQATPAP